MCQCYFLSSRHMLETLHQLPFVLRKTPRLLTGTTELFVI